MVKLGLELNPVLGTTLVDLYAKCDCTVEPHKLLTFTFVTDGDVVYSTTMISSLVERLVNGVKLYNSTSK